MRRWETYVALLAIIIGSLSAVAAKPVYSLAMMLVAIALVATVGLSLIRRARGGTKNVPYDPYERAQRIREERGKRYR